MPRTGIFSKRCGSRCWPRSLCGGEPLSLSKQSNFPTGLVVLSFCCGFFGVVGVGIVIVEHFGARFYAESWGPGYPLGLFAGAYVGGLIVSYRQYRYAKKNHRQLQDAIEAKEIIFSDKSFEKQLISLLGRHFVEHIFRGGFSRRLRPNVLYYPFDSLINSLPLGVFIGIGIGLESMEGFGRGFFPTFGGAGLVGVLGIKKKSLWRRFEKALKERWRTTTFGGAGLVGVLGIKKKACGGGSRKH